MSQLIVMVMDDPNKFEDILNAWLELGIAGATIFDSLGTGHFAPSESPDDLPLMPSLSDILQGRHENNRTIFSVVTDDFDIDRLAAATEAITGSFSDIDTGILFTVPVGRVWGLQPKIK
ncbi:MAG: hypothetical protein FJ030_11480 [Chloroflexi bacterium]|nr:hypothetical protein [Chloroflexota bacterium]